MLIESKNGNQFTLKGSSYSVQKYTSIQHIYKIYDLWNFVFFGCHGVNLGSRPVPIYVLEPPIIDQNILFQVYSCILLFETFSGMGMAGVGWVEIIILMKTKSSTFFLTLDFGLQLRDCHFHFPSCVGDLQQSTLYIRNQVRNTCFLPIYQFYN